MPFQFFAKKTWLAQRNFAVSTKSLHLSGFIPIGQSGWNSFLTKILQPVDRDRRFESVFSKKVNAGKRRTYFFDVRQTKGDDYFLTLTESTKRFNGDGYERHKIFLYKEDFNRFLTNLEEAITFIKTELMPNYDYEEFDRKHEEWDAQDDDHQERPPRPPRNLDLEQPDEEIDEDNSQLREKPTNTRFDDDLSW